MTQATYLSALQHSAEQGIEIEGSGMTSQRQPFWLVSSGTTDDSYVVTQVTAKALTCNCRAGKNGGYCKHRARVHDGMVCGEIVSPWRTGPAAQNVHFLRLVTR